MAFTLKDALAASYQNNPQIQSARSQLQATDEQVAIAQSGYRPSISANYQRGKQQTSFNNGPQVTGVSENQSLQVTQPLYRGGATVASVEAAREQVQAGQFTLMVTQQQVLLDTATAYMNAVQAESMLDLAHGQEKLLSEQLKSTQSQFQVGALTRTDVAQAQARLADAHAASIAAQGQVQSARAVLERLCGVDTIDALKLPQDLPPVPATLTEALDSARSGNPALLSALHTARFAQRQVRVSEASLLPQVNLVGSLSRDKGVGAQGGSAFDQDRVSVQVTVPLYQSGAEYARVRAAEAQARQRDFDATDARQSVAQSVRQSWEQLTAATATVSSRQSQIEAASSALEGVRQEHAVGTRTVIDVLNAEQELFTARNALVQADRDRVVAAYSLAFQLGALSPQSLSLDVTPYDAQDHAQETDGKFVGF